LCVGFQWQGNVDDNRWEVSTSEMLRGASGQRYGSMAALAV